MESLWISECTVHLSVASLPEIDNRMTLDPLTYLKIFLHDERGKKENLTAYIKSVAHSDKRKTTTRIWVLIHSPQNGDGMKAEIMFMVSENRYNIGSDGLCARLTACVALVPQDIRSVLNYLPKTFGRNIRLSSVMYLRRNDSMHKGSSADVLWRLFGFFASKNSRRFLQFGLTGQHFLH